MNITKKLNLWEQEGLLENSQKLAILDFEKKRSGSGLIQAFLRLGLFCIGMGILSFIAANWQEIHSSVKVIVYFILLSLTAFGIYKFSNILCEGLVILYALLLLAGIGLAAQIFQLQSDNLSALLFWSVLSLPLVFITKRMLFPTIWLPVFLVSLFDVTKLYELPFFEKFAEYMPSGLLLFFAAVWSWFYIVADYTKQSSLSRAARFWMILGCVFLVILNDNMVYWDYYIGFINESQNYYPAFAALILASFPALFYFYMKKNMLYFSCALIMLASSFIIKFCSFPFVGFMLTMLLLVNIMFFAAKQRRIKLLNLASGLAGLRIFLLYVDLIGSLMDTGLGLLGGGVLLLLLCYVVKKINRKAVA